MRRRNNVVKFRLSDDELAELQRKVNESGLNRNAFLVRMIQQQTIYPADKLSDLSYVWTVDGLLRKRVSTMMVGHSHREN